MEGDGRRVKFDAEKDINSPRFRAVIRATSGRRRRLPSDVKSYSHELNSNGTCNLPIRKFRGLSNPEEIVSVLRSKFKRLKEDVDSELGIFAGDLVTMLEKASEEHPEWREPLEDLLVTTQKCAEMPLEEFWSKCEAIVQNLDDRRQELRMGFLKKVHTRILFILTRCTRLLQLQKEGAYAESEFVFGLHHLSDLGFYPENGDGGLKVSLSAKDMKDRIIRKKILEYRHLSQDLAAQFSPDDSPGSRARISSWKKLPPAPEKGQKRVHDKQDDLLPKVSGPFPPTEKNNLNADRHADNLHAAEQFSEIISGTSELLSKTENVSQPQSGGMPKMICRICEFEIPTSYAEGHIAICTVADKCDSKGLSIEERLERVAEVLEKILAFFAHKVSDNAVMHNEVIRVRSSRFIEVSNGSCADHNNLSQLSPPPDLKNNLPEVFDNIIANGLNELHSTLNGSHSALSSGSMTPQSPLMTPRTSQIDILLSGIKAFSDLENFQQIESLLDIVHCIERVKSHDYSSLENLSSCLDDLNAVVDTRKVDALIVETFGRHIAKLLQEKFIHLCGQIDDGSNDTSNMMSDEDGSMRGNRLGAKIKDRTSIEDFEIIKPISRGAFGRVFLAKKRVTGDLFAIKVLKKADMIRKNAVESILAERNILISARNPFVVRFFYSFTCRENLYLVMEYLNGGDLYSLLRNLGCLDEEMAQTYIAEVVLALEYLHSLNVIHRDLKPDNLLIARDGHVKLTDFGLSKVGLINSTDDLSGPDVSGAIPLGDDQPQSAAQRAQKREQRRKQSAVGTPDYLAPEILLGMPHGPTADWWAVGVILFELLVGIPPFNAEHPQKIFDNIMNRDISWPQVPEEMSFEVYDLIDKLLIENPVQRLGATGAGEVKSHPFFKNINWDMLARQKAAFIPSTEGEEDTSYFACRHPWSTADQIYAESHLYEETSDMGSVSCSSSSPQSSEQDEDGDEFGSMADFAPNLAVKYSFSNFSFKNLSQLASMNYDIITKCSKESADASQS